jgi:hypothetical protein
MKKLILWVCMLIVFLFLSTKEPFTVKQPLIEKKYVYPPLDIYPYPRSANRVAQSAEDTFVVLDVNDILKKTTPQPAKIYTAFVMNQGATITLDNLKKYYYEFMNNSSNYLKIKKYNDATTLVNVKDINMEAYEHAIQDSTHYLKFIQFTGVTNPVIRSMIAEVLEQALSLPTPRGGQYVSICIYNDIPENNKEATNVYYVQSIINFPFITLPSKD